jgi:tetratricopeptide (TPR) repeat protein
MDSEHRHELHRNDLAKLIADAPEYLKKNQKIIIYAAVVAVLVLISAYMTIYKNKSQELQYQAQVTAGIQNISMVKMKTAQGLSKGVDNSMMLSSSASKLIGDSEQINNDLLKAIAQIKAGNTLRAELHYKPLVPEKPVIKYQVNQATQHYLEAIKLAGNDNNIIAIAKLGLGLCQEELGNFEEAKRIYSEIASDEKFNVSPAQTTANNRLNTMANYTKAVTFLPAPPKPIQGTTEGIGFDTDTVLESLNITPADSNK